MEIIVYEKAEANLATDTIKQYVQSGGRINIIPFGARTPKILLDQMQREKSAAYHFPPRKG